MSRILSSVRNAGNITNCQPFIHLPLRPSAFTLAETLITLVIIGVIAAITIPSLMNKKQETETTNKVRKTYATLSNAMTMYKAAGGDTQFTALDSNDEFMRNWFDTFLKPYLSLQKICYNTVGCWNSSGSYYLNGDLAMWSNTNGIGFNIITAVLNDGTLIDFDVAGQGGQLYGVVGSTGRTLFVYFDINGVKKPNTFGKDIFVAVYFKGNLVPAYYGATMEAVEDDCTMSKTGASCIRLHLQNTI